MVGKQVRGLEYAGAFVWSPIALTRKRKASRGCFQNFTIRGLSACSQQSQLSESWCIMTHERLEKVNFLVEAKVEIEAGNSR